MATKGQGGAKSVAKYVAEAQARRQKFADGGVPEPGLLGRVRDALSQRIGDKVDSLRANTPLESSTARAVREMGANNGLGVNPAKRDNFANGMDGVQSRQQQIEQAERNNLPPTPQPQPAEKPALQASEIRFATGTPYVEGPGTGTSDSIPAKLSKGEAVLPAKTVQTLGVDTVADLIEATNGKKPKTIGDSVRGKFADGGVPDPKKLNGVQVANTPAYELPANPKPNVNTDIAKGGVTSVSEPVAPKMPVDVEKPAFMRAAAEGKPIQGMAELSEANPALRNAASSQATSTATGAAQTTTNGAAQAAQPVKNTVDATKTAAKSIGDTVKGWWSSGLDAGKRGVDIAKSGVDAAKETGSALAKKAPLVGGLISGGLSAYSDLADGKALTEAVPKAITRGVYGAAGTALGLPFSGLTAGAANVFGGALGDRTGEMVGNYLFGDPNDSLKDHPVNKFLQDGANMGRTRTAAQLPATTKPLEQTVATESAVQAPTKTPTEAPSKKTISDTVQGVSPVTITGGIKRYDLGDGQSPLYTNLSAGENESFLNARKQALNSDPGWKPPRQPDLPYVNDDSPAGRAENDRRDQARVANEIADYREQGLAQRAADNKRSMQNQYAYEQIPEGTDPRTLAIMAYRDNQAREQAQNAAIARANDPRNILLGQIQSQLAGGGQLTKAGLAAIQGVMGNDTHRYATDVGASSQRYAADSSSAASRYHANASMAMAKLSDETQRRGQDITSDHNSKTNEMGKAKLYHDMKQQDLARTSEGNKQLNDLLKSSKHAIGVGKDGVPAVDAQKLADYATWLHNQSGGVDKDGRPQSLSAKMMGLNPDEANSALAAADNAYTVHNVFKRNAENNGLYHTSIGNGVPEFTVRDLTLADPTRNHAGWWASAKQKMNPLGFSNKVVVMKDAQGGEVAVPMSSLSPEEQTAFIHHAQLQAQQRQAPNRQ